MLRIETNPSALSADKKNLGLSRMAANTNMNCSRDPARYRRCQIFSLAVPELVVLVARVPVQHAYPPGVAG